MDSIIARPTNRVRVIVAEASGCCASEFKAVETARPSPSAGPMLPSAMVRPAVMIETTAMIVMLSIILSFGWFVNVSSFDCQRRLGLACARGGGDVNRRQNAENVGLHHAGQQAKQRHYDWKNEGRNGQQNRDDHRPAHHVAKQADGQGERPRKFADDVKWQHDNGWFNV